MSDKARGERVLIIEDDTTLAMGLELNLTAEGYRVTAARDGAEGLRLALEQQPDLVLLDLTLPGVDGFDLLGELRQAGREMPVIIVSARGEERDKLAGFGLGADDYLTKPFSLKELLAVLAAADVVICPDSGPAHMATAVRTPVIGLFATSNPERTGPYCCRDLTVNRYPDAARKFLGREAATLRWG